MMTNQNDLMLDLSMNAAEFRSYLTNRYLEEIANLICVELQCFVPISLASFTSRQSLKLHIKKSLPNVGERSRKLFYTQIGENGNEKYEISAAVLNLIELLRKELNCLLITAKKQSRLNFGKRRMSLTMFCQSSLLCIFSQAKRQHQIVQPVVMN